MKKIRKYLFLLCLPVLSNIGCNKQDISTSKNCVVGIITNDTLYKSIYEGCYANSLWIEVQNDDTLGENVNIYSPAPSLTPNPAIEYVNVIKVPVPNQISMNNRKDTLLGQKIYFQYRFAEESEISAIRNKECLEVYETHNVPVIVLTNFSFSDCPPENTEQ